MQIDDCSCWPSFYMMVQNVLNCCQNMDHINSMSARVIKVFVTKTGKVTRRIFPLQFRNARSLRIDLL